MIIPLVGIKQFLGLMKWRNQYTYWIKGCNRRTTGIDMLRIGVR